MGVAAAEQRFRLLIDSVKDYAIFMLDPQGHIQTWNAGAERIKQYSAAEVVGKHMSIFYPPEDSAAGKPGRLLEQAAREGRVEDEGWRLRKDGTPFWADMVLSAARSESGELLGFAKVTRDLTERRRAQEERLRLAQSQQAVRLRDEFLSIASHELKTPLTALLLQVQSARRVVEGAAASSLDVAVRSAQRLAALIETLLDVSRMASGALSLEPESHDLRELAQEVIDRLQLGAAHAGATLSLRAVDPVAGRWDALRISQVLTNLVSNAIRYGGGTPVEVTVRREGDRAVLEVSDRGPGVPEQDLERIFGRFERAASIRNFGGLGLGLYVARQIVEAHGGEVTARNRPEGGACVVVRLPIDARGE